MQTTPSANWRTSSFMTFAFVFAFVMITTFLAVSLPKMICAEYDSQMTARLSIKQ